MFMLRNYGLAGLGMIQLVALLHLLPVATYGKMQFVLACAAMAELLALPGAPVALLQLAAKASTNMLGTVLRWRMLAATGGLIALLATAGYYQYRGETDLAWALAGFAMLFPLSALNCATQILIGQEALKTLIRFEYTVRLLQMAATLTAAMLTPDRLVLLVVPAQAIAALAYGGLAWRWLRGGKSPDAAEKRDELRYVLKRSALAIMPMVDGRIDRVLVGSYFGPAELAIYSAARFVMEQLKSAYMAFYNVLLPVFSRLPLDEINARLPKTMAMGVVVVVLAAGLLDGFTTLGIHLFLFDKYAAALPLVHILLWGCATAVLGFVVQIKFTALRLSGYEFLNSVITPLSYFALLPLCIHAFGPIGVAYAVAIRYSLISVFLMTANAVFEHRRRRKERPDT